MLDYGWRETNILTHVAALYGRLAVAVNAAAKADKSQGRFYDALRELFVGAKVEGQTSFIVDWPQRPLSDSAFIVLRWAME